MTAYTITKGRAGDSDESFIESDAVGPAVTITLNDLAPDRPHCFLGVQMFDAGGAQVAGGAGSFAVQVRTWVNGRNEAPPTATISATAPVTIDWAAPTKGVTVTPTGLTGVTTWRVRLYTARN